MRVVSTPKGVILISAVFLEKEYKPILNDFRIACSWASTVSTPEFFLEVSNGSRRPGPWRLTRTTRH